jgi:MFS family permease
MTSPASPASPATAQRPPPGSAWAPFRHEAFAAMWSAQFVSNIGGWMQTVGAQWVMLGLTSSATYVALIQTAASLPVVLFAVLAGAIGDLVDRRQFLLITQALMLLAAAALGFLALAGLVTPWLLLGLIFAVGTGQALTSPTWQTLQPELVPPAERPQAISLGAVNMNLARAVGPAIGGHILAATSAGDGVPDQRGHVPGRARRARLVARQPARPHAAPGARWRGGPGRGAVRRRQPGAAGSCCSGPACSCSSPPRSGRCCR